MQIVGTDCVRNMIKSDFWVHRMRESIRLSQHDVVVIDDVRFRDEAELIKEMGGYVYLVRRPGGPQPPWHASEQPPIDMADDAFVNNGTLQEYHKLVRSSLVAARIQDFLKRGGS